VSALDIKGPEPIDQKAPDAGDLTLWSVTTIIGCLDKPGLLYWSAEEAARAALASRGSLDARVAEEGEAAVVKWLRDARFRRPKDRLSAASLGTATHACCEEYVLTGTRPDDDFVGGQVKAEGPRGMTAPAVKAEAAVVGQMLDRFDEFLERYQPAYQAAEVTVYHPDYGYAGTADCFLTIDGVPLIGDYKTSRDPRDSKGDPKTPYPEVALQLAAYRHATAAAVWRPRRYEKFRRRYYLLSQQERDQAVPPPAVEGGVVIMLTPEACTPFPVRCDETVHEAFLFVQEAARYSFQMAKDVIGHPLTTGGA
jgi:hypothetical protein